LEIEEHRTKVQEHTMKDQLKYFKHRDKKIQKTNKNMVSVLFQLNTMMCQAFIHDKYLLLTLL